MALAACGLAAVCAPPPGGGDGGPASAPPDDGRPAAGTVTTASGLRVSVAAEAASAGAPVRLVLRATNETSAEMAVDFADGQRYDFEVLQDGATLWRWAADMFFPQVVGRERVPPGGSLEWTERIEGGLPAGEYTVRGTLTTSPPISVETSLRIADAEGGP